MHRGGGWNVARHLHDSFAYLKANAVAANNNTHILNCVQDNFNFFFRPLQFVCVNCARRPICGSAIFSSNKSTNNCACCLHALINESEMDFIYKIICRPGTTEAHTHTHAEKDDTHTHTGAPVSIT